MSVSFGVNFKLIAGIIGRCLGFARRDVALLHRSSSFDAAATEAEAEAEAEAAIA